MSFLSFALYDMPNLKVNEVWTCLPLPKIKISTLGAIILLKFWQFKNNLINVESVKVLYDIWYVVRNLVYWLANNGETMDWCTFHLVHNFEEIPWGIVRLFFCEFHGTFFCYNLIVASLNLLGNICRHNTKIICTLYFGWSITFNWCQTQFVLVNMPTQH